MYARHTHTYHFYITHSWYQTSYQINPRRIFIIRMCHEHNAWLGCLGKLTVIQSQNRFNSHLSNPSTKWPNASVVLLDKKAQPVFTVPCKTETILIMLIRATSFHLYMIEKQLQMWMGIQTVEVPSYTDSMREIFMCTQTKRNLRTFTKTQTLHKNNRILKLWWGIISKRRT